jgi:hypothetical protein
MKCVAIIGNNASKNKRVIIRKRKKEGQGRDSER